jgi:hypothetical protein
MLSSSGVGLLIVILQCDPLCVAMRNTIAWPENNFIKPTRDLLRVSAGVSVCLSVCLFVCGGVAT